MNSDAATNIELLIRVDRTLREVIADIGPIIAECRPQSPDVDWALLKEKLLAAVAQIPVGKNES